MEAPTSGDIILRGERINDIPANRRPTCMVFQSLALFPHKNVGNNIEFSLKIRGVAKEARKAKALELMRLLRLPDHYYGRAVNRISGGERQRVALARALAFEPEILFFDEPLSALDYKLRKTLEKELKDIHRETKKTFVYITHSLEEAMVMSDRIGVMRDGKLVQIGTPQEIYSSPNCKFVSEFIGDVNVLPVAVLASGRLKADHIAQEMVAPATANGAARAISSSGPSSCASSTSRAMPTTTSSAASTTNTPSVRASSTRCGSASWSSSSRSSAMRLSSAISTRR